MNQYDVRRYALICAVNAEIKAMEVMNEERLSNGLATAYGEREFWDKAEELRNLAASHDEQL